MTRFTTINDVVLELRTLEPGFDLTDDEIMDVIRDNMDGRYEDLTDEDIDQMLVAAYEAQGIGREQAERIVNS